MPDSQELNRRDFIAIAATCVCAATCPFARTVKAGDDDDDETTKGPPPVPVGKNDVGTLADYSKDGVYDKWADSRHFLLVRSRNTLYAMSTVCTHKAGLLKVDAKGVIQCSKHHSIFDIAGQPTQGKAIDSGPLPRHAIALDAKGHIVVDTAEQFLEEDWKKPGAFLAIK